MYVYKKYFQTFCADRRALGFYKKRRLVRTKSTRKLPASSGICRKPFSEELYVYVLRCFIRTAFQVQI